jgi:hypothetical protein
MFLPFAKQVIKLLNTSESSFPEACRYHTWHHLVGIIRDIEVYQPMGEFVKNLGGVLRNKFQGKVGDFEVKVKRIMAKLY